MPLLSLIWMTALGMIAMALAWMSQLIVARLINEWRAGGRAADRAAVIQGLMGVLRGAPDAAEALRPYVGRARLMADALLELQGLIRGDDQERVLAELRDLGLVQTLSARLHRGSRTGRMAVLEALAALGGPEAHAAIRSAISSSSPEVRMAALKAMADSGARPSVGRLIDYVVAGEVEASRLFADLLRQVTAIDVPAALMALRRQDLTPDMRALLVDALGVSGDYGVLESLIQAASHPHEEVRTAAVRGLGRLQHPAGEGAIAGAMRDPTWIVRSAAAEAAGAAGFSRLVAGLDQLLADPEWWVRFRAGEALVAIGADGLSVLRRAAEGERALASRAAALAMAEGGVR